MLWVPGYEALPAKLESGGRWSSAGRQPVSSDGAGIVNEQQDAIRRNNAIRPTFSLPLQTIAQRAKAPARPMTLSLTSRRALLRAGLIAVPALAVSACEGRTQQPQRTPEEITYLTPFAGNPREKVLQPAIETFRRSNPSIGVHYRPGSVDDWRVMLTLEGSQAPDVVHGYPSTTRILADADVIRDLTDLVAKLPSNPAGSWWSVPDAHTYRERRYGLPFGTTQSAWIFNVQASAAAGVEPPAANQTIADLIEDAQRMTDVEAGRFGLFVGAPLKSWAGLVVSAKSDVPRLLSGDGRESPLHDEDLRRDFERILRLTTDSHVAPSIPELVSMITESVVTYVDRSGLSVLFHDGRVAMLPVSGTRAATAPTDGAWDFMPTPRHESSGAAWNWLDQSSTWVTAVAARRGVESVAVDFAAHLSGTEMSAARALDRTHTPDIRTFAESDDYLRSPPRSMSVVVDNTHSGASLGYGPPVWPEWSHWLEAIWASVIREDLGVETAFDELQRVGRTVLAGHPA